MNILFCDILRVKSMGTAATHMYGVLNGLSKIGHNVTFINRDHPRNEEEVNPSPSSLLGRLRNSIVAWPILRPVGGEIAILWHLFRAVCVFSLVFIALIRHRGRFDVLYRRGTIINSEYLLARMFNIPLVKEVNGIGFDEIRDGYGWGNRISLKVLDKIERFNMPKADKIIVVTSRLKEVLEQDYGVPGDKIILISNGTNVDLFKPMDTEIAKERLNLNQNNSYVCYVGAFHAWQGIGNLIKSIPLVLQECSDVRYLIVGDGPVKHELINLAEKIGVSDNVVFTGMVPYVKVPLYIGASDVCVFPAANDFRNDRVGGGSPLILPEYMACGRPVVIGTVVGLSKEVVESGSGLAVDMRNIDELARACILLLKEEQLRKVMGAKGRKVAIEKYSWLRVAEQVAEVCRSVVKQ